MVIIFFLSQYKYILRCLVFIPIFCLYNWHKNNRFVLTLSKLNKSLIITEKFKLSLFEYEILIFSISSMIRWLLFIHLILLEDFVKLLINMIFSNVRGLKYALTKFQNWDLLFYRSYLVRIISFLALIKV